MSGCFRKIFIALISLNAICNCGLAQSDSVDYFLPTWAIKFPIVEIHHPSQPSFGLNVEIKCTRLFSVQVDYHYMPLSKVCKRGNWGLVCDSKLSGWKAGIESRGYFFPQPNRSLNGLYTSLELFTMTEETQNDYYAPGKPPDQVTLKATGGIMRMGFQTATFRFGFEAFVGLAFFSISGKIEHEYWYETLGGGQNELDAGIRLVILLGDKISHSKG